MYCRAGAGANPSNKVQYSGERGYIRKNILK